MLVNIIVNKDQNPVHGITRYIDGTIAWHVCGMLHREDGPAVIWNNGSNQWYLNGIFQGLNGIFQRDGENLSSDFNWKQEGF